LACRDRRNRRTALLRGRQSRDAAQTEWRAVDRTSGAGGALFAFARLVRDAATDAVEVRLAREVVACVADRVLSACAA
jgi:hypothetical protein